MCTCLGWDDANCGVTHSLDSSECRECGGPLSDPSIIEHRWMEVPYNRRTFVDCLRRSLEVR